MGAQIRSDRLQIEPSLDLPYIVLYLKQTIQIRPVIKTCQGLVRHSCNRIHSANTKKLEQTSSNLFQ